MEFWEKIGETIETGLDNLFFSPLSPINRCIDYLGENYIKPIGEELQKSESGEKLLEKIDNDIENFIDRVEQVELEDVVKKIFGVDIKV